MAVLHSKVHESNTCNCTRYAHHFFLLWVSDPELSLRFSQWFAASLRKKLVDDDFEYTKFGESRGNCEKFWKKLVLFKSKSRIFQCLPWTWSMAIDSQMYLLTPVLIYPALKFGKKVLVTLLSGLVALSAWMAYKVSLENKLMVHKATLWGWQGKIRITLYNSNDFRFVSASNPLTQALHYPTHIHGSVFIIGMILGVYFDEIRDWLRKSAVSWLMRWRNSQYLKIFFSYEGSWFSPQFSLQFWRLVSSWAHSTMNRLLNYMRSAWVQLIM